MQAENLLTKGQGYAKSHAEEPHGGHDVLFYGFRTGCGAAICCQRLPTRCAPTLPNFINEPLKRMLRIAILSGDTQGHFNQKASTDRKSIGAVQEICVPSMQNGVEFYAI